MATLLREIYVGTAYSDWFLSLYEDKVVQSIDGNYSDIYLYMNLRATDTSAFVRFDQRDVWIHNQHSSIDYTQQGSEHNIFHANPIRIDHNADGTGSYSVGFGISTSFNLNGSASGGRTLPTVPRASSFSISGNTLGSSMTVNISRASSSFTHTLRYTFGGIRRDYTGVSTSQSFTPPLSDASQIPSSTSGTGTITVYTYNGGTYIGSKASSFTLYLPASVVPSFSLLSINRIDNGVPAAWGIYVRGKSKATVTINGASGIYGSTIASASINGDGNNSNSTTLTTNPLSAGTITFTGIVNDTRSRSVTKTASIIVYDNYPPSLQLKAERCKVDGTLDNFGTYIKITPTYTCASVNGKNTIATKSFSISGTSYTNTTCASGASIILGKGDILVSKSYDITGSVSDLLGQSSGTIRITVASSSVPLNLRDDSRGIGIGKYGEKQDAVDCAWDIYSIGEKLIKESDTIAKSGKLSIVNAPPATDSGLYFLQTANNTTLLPDEGWWHLIRMQHSGYTAGYWYDLAFPFFNNKSRTDKIQMVGKQHGDI